MDLVAEPLAGAVKINRVFGRLVAPTVDLRVRTAEAIAARPRADRLRGTPSRGHDMAKVLARLEREQPQVPDDCLLERFTRVLTTTAAVTNPES
jgi:hypothetical protein